MKKFKSFEELKDLVPLISYQQFKDENIIVVSNDNLLFLLKFIKSHFGYRYNLLTSIAGVDLLGKIYRFIIVYDFLSIVYNSRIRIKVFIDQLSFVPSIIDLYINSNWWEREIWDLYGIYFDKHPDLRRILTDYGFEGNPMRKDFPQNGYIELRYNESKKRVVVEPIELTQEFRSFTFETPW